MPDTENKKIVGTDINQYPQKKNFSSLPFRNYEFREIKDIYKALNWLSFKLQKKNPLFYLNSFRDFDLNGVDLFHFFNVLSFGKKPWITTFESSLPRWGEVSVPKTETGMRLLAGKSCKQIIAISECSLNIEKQLIQNQFPSFADEILPKLKIFHPVQNASITSMAEKNPPEDFIRFVLIGLDFFRKGGLETLRVFDRLIVAGEAIQLVIISRMNIGDYATHAGNSEKEEAIKLIAKHPKHITWHKMLPNAEVLAILRDSHVGLLPTWADTYGYSVLEAQSAGCAVLSTDIRALPEINTQETGWIIPVRKDQFGDAILMNDDDRKTFSIQLENNLEITLKSILADPVSIQRKGVKGLERIKNLHSPELRAVEMEGIYDLALS